MYIKCFFFFLIPMLTAHGSKYFGINDGYRYLVEKIQSFAVRSNSTNERWIEQKLDHFDNNEKRIWNMRYYERLDLWKTDGPIYLFIGGEFTAQPAFLELGIVYDLAKETGGAMFMSEHRYYGSSQPVNKSVIEDMIYLSTSQALADVAHLLRTIKEKTTFKNSKVVVIGASYAGNLAAWMRLTYPDLVDAAIASSAPVLAKRDFQEYLEVVNNDYEQYGTSGCLQIIQKHFKRYDSLFKNDKGIKQLKEEENICDEVDMTRPENKQLFFLVKVYPFMIRSQYGTTIDIEQHCSVLNDKSVTFTGLDDEQYYYWNQKQHCNNYDFDNLIKEYQKSDFILTWTYQTCTEFGYFQTSTSDKQSFTNNIPVEFYEKTCRALFGEGFNRDKVDSGVKKINEIYGGKTPDVIKVVFVNGELDPWSSLGVLEDISYEAPAVLIARSSHCADIYPESKDDVEELKEARAHIKQLIKRWIGIGDYIKFHPLKIF